MYGLGSLVKKAFKGVKNIVKSPIGKSLLLGAVGFGIPGTSFGGMFGKGALSGFLGKAGMTMPGQGFGGGSGLMGLFSKAKNAFSGLGLGSKIGLGSGLLTLGMKLFPQEDDEDDDVYKKRLSNMKPYLTQYMTNLNRGSVNPTNVENFVDVNTREYSAMGGRIGYARGTDLEAGAPSIKYTGNMKKNNMQMASETPEEEFELMMQMELLEKAYEEAKQKGYEGDKQSFMEELRQLKDIQNQTQMADNSGIMQEAPVMAAMGGLMRTNYAMGTKNPIDEEDEEDSYRAGVLQAMNRMKAMGGGMMNIPTGNMKKNSAGVIERDYRDEGGFVPVGIKEKADDVPAMLSKNEFVMTADAVRGVGDGNIEKGAQRMYNLMKQNEGKVA
tara:strand:- start:2801 stop:3955 length:1155 start_codon:yes stop_codon:yes gene_type:complete